MTLPSLIALLGALSVLGWVVAMVRRGLLAEHFAAVWLGVSSVCVALALFPGLLYTATAVMHFSLPVNLLFMSAALVQLVVSVHLSVELGRRQAETRRLAEAAALLDLRLRAVEALTSDDRQDVTVLLPSQTARPADERV